MSFLPKQLNEIAIQAMKQTIDMTNNFRKHLKAGNAIEQVNEKTLNVLGIRFAPDYTVEGVTVDADAIVLPISNTVEEVNPLTIKMRTPKVNGYELDDVTTRNLARALQNAVLIAENKYILENVKAKYGNEIDGTTDPVGALEEAVCNAVAYVGDSPGILAINKGDIKYFTGHTPEYNSIRSYVEDLGVQLMALNTVKQGEAYYVPATPEAVVLGQIHAEGPEMVTDYLNKAVALLVEEKIVFVVKTPEAVSKITLV